jgi:hypothetical protein
MEFICNGGLHFVQSDIYKNKFLPFTLSSRYGFQVSFRLYTQSTAVTARGQRFGIDCLLLIAERYELIVLLIAERYGLIVLLIAERYGLIVLLIA